MPDPPSYGKSAVIVSGIDPTTNKPQQINSDATGKLQVAGNTDPSTGQGKTLLFAPIDVAGGGDNTVVAADATRKIKVVSYVIVVDGAVAVRWKSGAGANLSGAMSFLANGGLVVPEQPSGHVLETAVNQALVLNLSSAVGARGHLSYFLEL